MTRLFKAASLVTALLMSVPAYADVTVSDAWARATRPGQKVGAAYMTLQSPADTALVKVESPAAGTVEIHTMTMNDGVMKMRMLENLPLKANETVKLAPGGFHLMLFDLAKPLQAGETVQFTLHFKDSAGNTSSLQTDAPVRTK